MDDLTKFQQLELKASSVFTPSQPIANNRLFAGRLDQVRRIIDAVNEPGRHAILYGERGTGKTSLANNLSAFLTGTRTLAPRIGCISNDSYSDLWRKAFKEITFNATEPRVGLRESDRAMTTDLAASFQGRITHDDVRRTLTRVGEQVDVIIIFDEFDTLSGTATRKAMAETIKLFSDHSVPATLVLVGVADNVTGLLADHRSVERAIVQVQMPRMPDDELGQILENGMKGLGMRMTTAAKDRIIAHSKGLPHYTHLLGLFATRAALENESLLVDDNDVEHAIHRALKETQQSTIDAYEKATTSPQRNHLYRQVLLACALAETDKLGYFSAGSVRVPLSKIMSKTYEIPSFVRHLNEFCDEKRGCILQKTGEARRFRFRFTNPIMQPYVILQGRTDNLIPTVV